MATLFGDYLGFIEFEIEPEHWIIAGLTPIYYKKSPQCYSKLIMSGLVFTELFRSYGLGELGSLIGITIIEDIGLNDLVFEDATVHNLSTHHLVEKIGFHPYGLIQDQSYDITGLFGNNSFLVGFYRTYRYSSSLLYFLLQTTTDPNKKILYKIEFELNQQLLNLMRKCKKTNQIDELIL